VLSIAGGLWLAVFVNLIASLIALLTLATYLLFYTPLKRRTPLCTLVGAFPGAAPPLIGYAAATGKITWEAWLLYAILFLWQFPHFMAIAWMYREDYARAGYLTLPRGQQRTHFMVWQTLVFSTALVPITLVPSFLKQAGVAYVVAVLLLSLVFLYYSARLAISKSNQAAHRLLFASIVYLPVVLGLIVGFKNG
jgi:protoheme IX farnesyltransferase